ncbi:MAG: adenylosuccinate lyase [Bacteroidales bacterium]|nr:adenylosuccinate lyase [Candidatus Cacconaster merdequi]
MGMDELLAISPVDGRYASITGKLSAFFSEYALMRYRVKVEAEYFIRLCEIPLPQLRGFDESVIPLIRKIYIDFTVDDAQQIKEIERTTNHDVKAVEYYLKRRFTELGIEQYSEFIHFGLTSQDINNTAIPLALMDAIRDVYLPEINEVTSLISGMARQWSDVPMLARTHGQPATPTRVGKEMAVFAARLFSQTESLEKCEFPAKFGGAVGNMNAHHVAYPGIDWNGFAKSFIEDRLGLKRSYPTTQIDHYDGLAAIFDNIRRINTILLDFSKDIWTYISMEYFSQRIVQGEVGSSTMPHKVNPIDFENAEGNLALADALFGFLSEKLPVSRLQRDLTDSTVLRNIGVPLAHSIIALSSLKKGIGKLILNRQRIDADLENNWAVVAEAIQTILRREGYPKPYETLKSLTRNCSHITKEAIRDFISSLDIEERVKAELYAITPQNYTGI